MGDRVVATHDVLEEGLEEPGVEFVHAAEGDVGEIVGFGDEAPTYLVDFGRSVAEVFREEIRPCVPFPEPAPDELAP